MAACRATAHARIAGLILTTALATPLLIPTGAALAQPAPAAGAPDPLPPPPGPRFAFAPVEGGALKLDTETGKVSLCAKGPQGFACTAVPDSRDAYEAEIGRLQGEIAALKRGGATNPETKPAPDTSDLDAALDYADQWFRWLKQKVDELRAPDQSERL